MTWSRIRQGAVEIIVGLITGFFFLCLVVGFFVILERVLGFLS